MKKIQEKLIKKILTESEALREGSFNPNRLLRSPYVSILALSLANKFCFEAIDGIVTIKRERSEIFATQVAEQLSLIQRKGIPLIFAESNQKEYFFKKNEDYSFIRGRNILAVTDTFPVSSLSVKTLIESTTDCGAKNIFFGTIITVGDFDFTTLALNRAEVLYYLPNR